MQNTDMDILKFPMGPTLREFFGFPESDYRGFENPNPSEEAYGHFSTKLIELMETKSPASEDEYITLIEELVGMKIPLLAIRLADAYRDLANSQDFRYLLALGNAALMVGDLGRAESLMFDAQSLLPEEPAPYVNMAMILLQQERVEEALEWVETGIASNLNFRRLWEQLYQVYIRQTPSSAAHRILETAQRFKSWVGCSLAAELLYAADPLARLELLQTFYNPLIEDEEFLIEYTGLLGVAGEFAKINPVIWQFEKIHNKKEIAWQLQIHKAQSWLAQNDFQSCLSFLEKIKASGNEDNTEYKDHQQKAVRELAIEELRAMALQLQSESSSVESIGS